MSPSAIITAPVSVVAGNDLVVSSIGSVSSKPPKFKVKPPGTPFKVATVADPPETICIVGRDYTASHPGVFKFQLVANGPDDVDVDTADVVVTPVPPVPQPTPTPNPAPTPDPAPDGGKPPKPNPIPVAPVTGKIYATLFYSLADASKGAAGLRQAGLITTLALDDCKWSAWPDSAVKVKPDGTVSPQTIVAEGNYQPSIDAAGGLPAVVFQDQTGKILAAIRAGSADEIVAKVKAFRGKN